MPLGHALPLRPMLPRGQDHPETRWCFFFESASRWPYDKSWPYITAKRLPCKISKPLFVVLLSGSGLDLALESNCLWNAVLIQ